MTVTAQCICLRCEFLDQELIIMLHIREIKQPHLHSKNFCQARFFICPCSSEEIAKMTQSPAKFESKLVCNFVRSNHVLMLDIIGIKCSIFSSEKSCQDRFFLSHLSL